MALLRAIAMRREIAAAMKEGGYTEEDHREGFRLLLAACDLVTELTGAPDAGPARAAIGQIDRWVVKNFARLEAAVERLHPDDADLFAGIDGEMQVVGEGVVRMATLLARIEERERGGGPAAAVVKTLARRGLNAAERARLAALVRNAQHAEADAVEPPPSREAELLAVYRWYTDWSTTARAVVTRGDYLISMGLAGRGKKREEASHACRDGQPTRPAQRSPA
jgi:hypothetical protein